MRYVFIPACLIASSRVSPAPSSNSNSPFRQFAVTSEIWTRLQVQMTDINKKITHLCFLVNRGSRCIYIQETGFSPAGYAKVCTEIPSLSIQDTCSIDFIGYSAPRSNRIVVYLIQNTLVRLQPIPIGVLVYIELVVTNLVAHLNTTYTRLTALLSLGTL